ncbi:MAG: chromate efflux transporter [Pseudomonadota bacterium]
MTGQKRTASEVFFAFLKLGVSSFGGPIAHIAYFRTEFVQRRKWLSDSQFAELLALCQFLPGPASSQLGFGIGLTQAGPLGALSAFVAFTLPSALLLFGFAALLPAFSGAIADAAIHGLKLVALAVVAHGLVGMLRSLTPDWQRIAIAALALLVMLASNSAWFQLAAIALGGCAGLAVCRGALPRNGGERLVTAYGRGTGFALLATFVLLLLGLPLLAGDGSSMPATADAFYRAGALVFGGGHVVLPLLEETVVQPGWIDADQFIAGYGAAQAVPGPMFTLATYLGALLPGGSGGLPGALLATLMMFLPGFLLLAGILPVWQRLSSRPSAARFVAGVNAAVVGILGAALYDPVFTSAAASITDLAIAALAFAALLRWNVSALWIVAWCVGARIAAAQAGI